MTTFLPLSHSKWCRIDFRGCSRVEEREEKDKVCRRPPEGNSRVQERPTEGGLSFLDNFSPWMAELILFCQRSKSLSRALHQQFLALLAFGENIKNLPFTLLQHSLRTPNRTSCSDARVRNIGWPRGDLGHFLQGGGEVYKREPKGTLGGPFCPFDSRWTLLSFWPFLMAWLSPNPFALCVFDPWRIFLHFWPLRALLPLRNNTGVAKNAKCIAYCMLKSTLGGKSYLHPFGERDSTISLFEL